MRNVNFCTYKKYFPLVKSINWTDGMESVCKSVSTPAIKWNVHVMQHVASVTVNLKKKYEICMKNAIDSIIISILSEPLPPHIGVSIWFNLFCSDAIHLGTIQWSIVYTHKHSERKTKKNVWKYGAWCVERKKIGCTVCYRHINM